MGAIEASLPPEDGVARFNHLYLAVTREVLATGPAGFEDPDFISRLDVAFAGLYFAAFDAAEAGAPVERAWAPLFDARSNPRVAPIQFALAGMNAHINRDLCVALFEVWGAVGVPPERGSPQHRDFVSVNAILERVEARVKDDLATGLVGIADDALGRLDDVLAIWSVARARDAAWTHAEALWALRGLPDLSAEYLLTLSRTVGLAGRGLLLPIL